MTPPEPVRSVERGLPIFKRGFFALDGVALGNEHLSFFAADMRLSG